MPFVGGVSGAGTEILSEAIIDVQKIRNEVVKETLQDGRPLEKESYLSEVDKRVRQRTDLIKIGMGGVNIQEHDKHRVNCSTVTQEVTVITESNIENLNHDLDAVQKLTKDQKIHVRIVLSLVRDFEPLKKDFQKIQEDLGSHFSHGGHV